MNYPASHKRKLKRIQLRCNLNVLNEESDELLGQVIDIHTAGLLLMSVKTFEKDVCVPLKVELPEPILGKQTISFEAKSVWSKPEAEMGFHTTGFFVPEMPEESKQIIYALVEKFGISK